MLTLDRPYTRQSVHQNGLTRHKDGPTHTCPKNCPLLVFLLFLLHTITHSNGQKIFQLIKPNKTLNLALGFTFICVSSYLILAYLGDIFKIFNITENSKSFILYGGLFVVSNFIMALWIIKNSISNRF